MVLLTIVYKILYSKRFFSRLLVVSYLQNKRFCGDTDFDDFTSVYCQVFKEEIGREMNIDKDFCQHLLKIVEKNSESITNTLLEKLTTNIKIDTVEDILICGLAEMLFSDTDKKIIISTYSDLCSCFCKSYTGLVSGVLNSL